MTNLLQLAERVEAAEGADRELDADIAEQIYGWRPFAVGPDYDGENSCCVLTPGGYKIEGFAYPPRGKLPRWYHVEPYTRDSIDPAVPKDFVRKQLAAALRARADHAPGGER